MSAGNQASRSKRPAATRFVRRASMAAVTMGLMAAAGCGNNYRPVITAINPVGPASQPTKYAVAISDPNLGDPNGTLPGLVTFVDFSGDTVLITGMGHEMFRIVNGKRIPWNDADVVRELLGKTKNL